VSTALAMAMTFVRHGKYNKLKGTFFLTLSKGRKCFFLGEGLGNFL
jgi:hypothetical protein